MTSADVTGAAALDRRPQAGPSIPSLGAIVGGLALVVLALTWPSLVLVGVITRGSLYFWVFLLGCAIVALIGYGRFLNERALRRIRRLSAPDAADDAALARTFAQAGLADAIVWRAPLPPNTVQTFGAVTLGGIRRDVVLPLASTSETPDPTTDAAGDDLSLALRAREEFTHVAPWWRPVQTAATAALVNPIAFARELISRTARSARRSELFHVGPSRPVSLVGALLLGYALCVAVSQVRGDGRVDSTESPWSTFAAYALFAAGILVYLLISPSRWPLIHVEGTSDDPAAPLWKGSNDPRRVERNLVVLQARRSYITVLGSFLTWLAATFWLLLVPMAFAEKAGWITEATLPFQIVYAVAVAPAMWLGAAAVRTRWGMTTKPRPAIALVVWLVTYVAVTGLIPLLMWLVLRTGVIDENSPVALGITAGVVALLLTIALVPLADHLIGRLTDPTDAMSAKTSAKMSATVGGIQPPDSPRAGGPEAPIEDHPRTPRRP